MSAEEHYDIIIVGGGPNGTTAAAYLSKCGLSVCVLEERPEAGGSCETAEPMAGVRIIPHSIVFYAAPAPGFEQLELWKYGFRMVWNPLDFVQTLTAIAATTKGMEGATPKDMAGYWKVSGLAGNPPFARELMRATHWCPPHPPEVESNEHTIPYMQVYKQYAPDVWSPEILDMTLFDFLDEWLETEPFKMTIAGAAVWSGPYPHWEGQAIPSLTCGLLTIHSGCSSPRGGMHGYFHSIFRCAVAHGAVFRTCCPVEEIIVSNGRAVGVRLRDDAATAEKTIWADKAVISACDVKQTFLELIGPRHLDRAFLQKIKDISLKGGPLWSSTYLLKKPLSFKPKFTVPWGERPWARIYPMDSREIYYENVRDVDAYKGNPSLPPERYFWYMAPSRHYDITDCEHYHPKGFVTTQFAGMATVPQYHVEGPDAADKVKDKIDVYLRQAFSQQLDGLDDDNVIHNWLMTPYEEQLRNRSLLGGTWCGRRHCDDQLWTNSPIPELARYRVPGIDGLYLCHQSSGHPGALCLMAIPYNLMHILIEDGIAEPGDWWYPSPWYIPEKGKISAIPVLK